MDWDNSSFDSFESEDYDSFLNNYQNDQQNSQTKEFNNLTNNFDFIESNNQNPFPAFSKLTNSTNSPFIKKELTKDEMIFKRQQVC